MKSIGLALVIVLALPGPVLGQWRNRKAMPHNCQIAESLVGPPDGTAEVQTNYHASGDSTTALVSSPSPPNLILLLDDTSALALGRAPVGRFNGPPEVAIAPIAVHTLPAWSLALARAKTTRLIVDSDTLKILQQDLREFNALYRFATCDSVPAR